MRVNASRMTCRYELWCIARAAAARYCVLQCSVPRETAETWNAGRPAAQAYSEAAFKDLWGRYEEPDSRNRWDKPLFRLNAAENAENSSTILQVGQPRHPAVCMGLCSLEQRLSHMAPM